MAVEPVPNERAAVATTAGKRLLVIADYHAGIETVLRSEGVNLASQASTRRERVLGLLEETGADHLVILGDLVHAIGDLWDEEQAELTALFEAISVPVTLIKGNHDGTIESFLAEIDHDITVTPPSGTRIGEVGFVHGHTWPGAAGLDSEILCCGHEHPVVRLEDSVGGRRLEAVWLRGRLNHAAFEGVETTANETGGEIIVFPAFNELSGGTWVNVPEQEFLSPFLPEGIDDGQAYLLDGTRLGSYSRL